MNINLEPLIGRFCRSGIDQTLRYKVVGYLLPHEDSFRPRLVLLSREGHLLVVMYNDVIIINDGNPV